MTFNKDYFKGIDLNLAAAQEHGTGATAIRKGDHAWDWQAKMPDGSIRGINMNLAAQRQMSSTAKAFMTGASAFDWTFADLAKVQHKVIPVVLVTADKIYDINGVKEAVKCLKSKIMGVQEWLRQEIDETFDVIPPLVFYTNVTAAQVTQWNNDMSVEARKFDYFYKTMDAVKAALGNSYTDKHIYLTSFYGADIKGSAAVSPLALVRSTVFDHMFKPFEAVTHTAHSDTADDCYVIAHELLHTFGADHPPEGTLNRDRMVMWIGRFPNPILRAEDRAAISNSPFLK